MKATYPHPASPPQSAATARYEVEALHATYGMLSDHPDMQPEAIARHYVAHAFTALQLLHMVELQRQTGFNAELDQGIKYLTEQIKTNHKHSLGLELTWPNK